MNAHANDAAWASLWQEARTVDILSVAERLGAKLKRGGADWTGHCPGGCTSHGDGFIVTPGKGIFLCRPSGATGDAVDMVVHAQAFTKAEALEFVTGRDLPGKQESTPEEKRARQEDLAKREAANRARAEQEAKEAEARRLRDEEAIEAVLRRAVAIEGTQAAAYLAARGLCPPKSLTKDLRFVTSLGYWAPGEKPNQIAELPAMVAIIRDIDGEAIGLSMTYMDPAKPRKWIHESERNVDPKNRKYPAVKVRGGVKGGMIRLGPIGSRLAIAEGAITALSWHQLRTEGAFGDVLAGEDISLAAAVSLGNLAGAWTTTQDHPTRKGADGRPTKIPGGIPDMARPGVILPAFVREVLILGDSDSEAVATHRACLTGARRFAAEGRTVATHFGPRGMDWNDALLARARGAEQGQAA